MISVLQIMEIVSPEFKHIEKKKKKMNSRRVMDRNDISAYTPSRSSWFKPSFILAGH